MCVCVYVKQKGLGKTKSCFAAAHAFRVRRGELERTRDGGGDRTTLFEENSEVSEAVSTRRERKRKEGRERGKSTPK